MAIILDTDLKKFSICDCGCKNRMPYLTAHGRIRKYINRHHQKMLKGFWLGKTHSRDYKKKMGLACSSKIVTEETKNKLREFNFKKNPIHINYFKKLNTRNAYILGYLFADGYVRKQKIGDGYILSFLSIDKELIDKIKDEFGIQHRKTEIRQSGYKKFTSNRLCKIQEAYFIRISNYYFIKYLIKQGMPIGRKSFRIKIPKEITENKSFFFSFFRGFFDGDGSINSIKNKFQSQSQPKAFIKMVSRKFLIHCQKILFKFGIKSNPIKKSKNCNAYKLSFTAKQNIYNLYTFIYKNNNNLFLSRKKKRFEEFFKIYDKKYFKGRICQLQ